MYISLNPYHFIKNIIAVPYSALPIPLFKIIHLLACAAESEDAPLLRRKTSRRKAKEQSAAKREAQAELLLDGDDPTLNNPALDLEDSDVDDEWTPLKAGLEKTRV